MQIYHQVTRQFQTNTYLLYDEATRDAVWIDPGERIAAVEQKIESEGLILRKILLTHGHADHIGAAEYYREKYQCVIGCYIGEKEMMEDPSLNLTQEMGVGAISLKCDEFYTDGQRVQPFDLQVWFTPGHTSGSCCFQWEDVIFCGDLIFQGAVGRWDLPTGNFTHLMSSFQRILNQDGNYRLLSGHGEETSTQIELQTNPFVRYAQRFSDR